MAFVVLPGADASGNGNDWTANNINNTDSTATTYDIMSDVPTLTDEDTANYATLNPLKQSGLTFSEANLTLTGSPSTWSATHATIDLPDGKWYWEITIGTFTTLAAQIGIFRTDATFAVDPAANANGYIYSSNGQIYNNGSGSSYGASYTTGDTIGVAFDATTGTLSFYKNGTSQGTAWSGLTGRFSPIIALYTTIAYTNFGQRPFAYTPPTGYKKLNTYNLPDSAIKDGSQYFSTVLYTGDFSTNRTISVPTLTPDFTWIKARSIVDDQIVYDTVRQGLVGPGARIKPNSTEAESDLGDYVELITNGFKVSTGTYNNSGVTFASWNWKAGGTAVSNTDGTITSTVSANTTAGFSVVSYTGAGNGTDTIGHGLGVTPSLVFWKSRSVTEDWLVTSTLFPDPEKNFLKLNLTNAIASISAAGYTLNSLVIRANTRMASGTTYIAYCFASVEGYSKFGSYTGNGSVDGPFVYTGFRPAFVLVKCTSLAGQGWFLLDSERDSFNIVQDYLMAQSTGAEASIDILDFISNGFKIRQTGAGFNTSAATYIYMAFAENPMKHSLAR